jgi:hypothetical protein
MNYMLFKYSRPSLIQTLLIRKFNYLDRILGIRLSNTINYLDRILGRKLTDSSIQTDHLSRLYTWEGTII